MKSVEAMGVFDIVSMYCNHENITPIILGIH